MSKLHDLLINYVTKRRQILIHARNKIFHSVIKYELCRRGIYYDKKLAEIDVELDKLDEIWHILLCQNG
jgi:hypothetical protein